AWVVDRNLHIHVAKITTLEALRRMECLRVRKAVVVDPTAIVESSSFHDKRIILPCADGVPEPRWIRIGRMAPAIRENLPVVIEFLEEDQRDIRRLDQLEGTDKHRVRNTMRQAHTRRPGGAEIL